MRLSFINNVVNDFGLIDTQRLEPRTTLKTQDTYELYYYISKIQHGVMVKYRIFVNVSNEQSNLHTED